ncbi:MAG: DUF1345 domain-containing protein [Myxococcales bacterium]|nr:DUF1345 domain-containing protein [Myxococcales bacterium]
MTPPDSIGPRYTFFSTRRASGRLMLALVCGLLAAALCPRQVDWHLRGVVGWDVAAFVLLSIVWPRIARADADTTRTFAGAEDPGRTMVFLLAVMASLFSLFAGVVVLRRARAYEGAESILWSTLAVAAVILSWTLTHTAFTLRYAHLFYAKGREGGLAFPGTERPSELDFAYFAFTIGMCFQVSDVAVTQPLLRRAALMHALLSFIYNTTILALVLNLVFGFLT